jgi:transposase-like protein
LREKKIGMTDSLGKKFTTTVQGGSVMRQILLPGFPEGASRIGTSVSVLKKEGRVTYFVGEDNFLSHKVDDKAGLQLAISTLIANRHARASEVETSPLGLSHRTLMRWMRQYNEGGPSVFYEPRGVRSGTVITLEKAIECGRLLDEGMRIAEVARCCGIKESTLRKAIAKGRILGSGGPVERDQETLEATTKSERCRFDAEAAKGLGTACTRVDERIAAAFGLIQGATARYQRCKDVFMGGLLVGLPALCANGLFSGLGKHIGLPKGFYSAMHILMLLGFMALGRLRRPEALRHVPPGEIGKVVGLDRAPEARTLREKIALMSASGTPHAWMKELSRSWMEADPEEAGYLYVDGHVRVYHGQNAVLPRRYVSRERLCLRGTTDYWVNDALGRPFFVVSKTVTDGLSATLLNEIAPELLASVPKQPSAEELAADPLLHRFVVIFDREGATHHLLAKLWEQRIGAVTYRKAVTDKWDESSFTAMDVPVPGGGTTRMKLASRENVLTAGDKSINVLEVRRLTSTGHQTAIITTARRLSNPVIAGRMFARWCQENFFMYMMQHYDIDGLVQYGSEEIPDTLLVVNPSWRSLDKAIRDKRSHIRKLLSQLGAATMDSDEKDMQLMAERMQDIQALQTDVAALSAQRRQTPRKAQISTLPESERPRRLMPLGKALTDTVKMIAYRAETALVGLISKHMAKPDEARALIRELFVSSADIIPNEAEGTLIIRIHRMVCPAHDKAISALFAELNQQNFRHPETNARMIYELV